MPELPEVERGRRLVESAMLGKTIREVSAAEDEIVFNKRSSAEVESALRGRRVVAVRRKGKNMWVELGGAGQHPIFHFGMSGSFQVEGVAKMEYAGEQKRRATAKEKRKERKGASDSEGKSAEWPPRFTKVSFKLDDGTRCAFINVRRLGRVHLVDDPVEHLAKLAPDPVTDLPPLAVFREALCQRRAPVKAVLLDQEAVVCGIGNWLIDEIMYQSGLHPAIPSDTLSESAVEAIYNAMTYVLSVACGVNADASKFPSTWLFHYRWGFGKADATNKMPDGARITHSKVGGRTTAVVASVQKRSGAGHAVPRSSRDGAAATVGADDGDGEDVKADTSAAKATPRRQRQATTTSTSGKATRAVATRGGRAGKQSVGRRVKQPVAIKKEAGKPAAATGLRRSTRSRT